MAAYYQLGQDKNYPPVKCDIFQLHLITELTRTTYRTNSLDYTIENTSVNGQLVNEHVNVQGDHYKLIREIGAASTILLKNTKNSQFQPSSYPQTRFVSRPNSCCTIALPIDFSKVKNLAILGSNAGANPDGPNGCSDRGCDRGTLAIGWGSGSKFRDVPSSFFSTFT
jgi:beta-glucosidase